MSERNRQDALNNAGWVLHDEIRQILGEVPVKLFNNLKPCLQKAIDRYEVDLKPVKPAWNGPEDGLPPVGLTVEVFDDREPHFSYAMHIGQRVRIVAHDVLGEGDDEGTPVAVYAFNHPKGEGYHALVAGKFRPIRTAEQLAAEERERGIKELLDWVRGQPVMEHRSPFPHVWAAMYDAGLRAPVQP